MAPEEERREVWLLADSGQLVKDIHPRGWCSGVCVVHRPSAHHMRKLELSFDVSRKAFQRTCTHGAVHHDPDERTYWTTQIAKALSKEYRVRGGAKLHLLATSKLNAWACPLCPCGCCDLTKLF